MGYPEAHPTPDENDQASVAADHFLQAHLSLVPKPVGVWEKIEAAERGETAKP